MTAIPEKRKVDPTVLQPIPKHLGFGTEEDSLGSFKCLDPNMNPQKVYKKDFVKLFREGDIILRFSAKFKGDNTIDNTRNFIVQYYMGDDSMIINELAHPDSGIKQGKFLEKNKYKNSVTGN